MGDWAVVGAELEVVRPQDRADHAEEARRIRSSSRLTTASICCSMSVTTVSTAPRSSRSGSSRSLNSSTSSLVIFGMPEQRLLHVGVAERDPRLAEVLRDRAEDDDLPARETGAEHEPVEAVVLDLAAPDAEERRPGRCRGPGRHPRPRPGARSRRATRACARRAKSRTVARRRPSRPCARASAARRRAIPPRREQLAADEPLRRLERPIEAHDRLGRGAQLLDAADVRDRRASDPLVAVGGWERALVARGTACPPRPRRAPRSAQRGDRRSTPASP